MEEMVERFHFMILKRTYEMDRPPKVSPAVREEVAHNFLDHQPVSSEKPGNLDGIAFALFGETARKETQRRLNLTFSLTWEQHPGV